MGDRYFEDLAVGDSEAFGSYEVTKAEIVEFAEKYDPQPFHVDEEAAAASMFGGLVASGWHTTAMTMRMLVDNVLNDSGAQGALGVEDLAWHRPVRPGDVLSVETEILDKSEWDDDHGLVHNGLTTFAGDESVMSLESQVLWKRREE
jgi:acyl dehydratase